MATPRLKRNQTDLRRYLYGDDYTKNVDEGSLTDQELADRLTAFQELGQAQGTIDPAEIQRELETAFSSRGDHTAAQNAKTVADYIAQSGQVPDSRTLQQILNPTNAPGLLQNIAQDQGLVNQISKLAERQVNPIKTEDDVKRLQDLISGRKTSADRNSAVEDYLTKLPDELKTSREDFLKGQTDRAVQEFQDYGPQALGNLNARGLLFSGSPEDVLTSKATDLAGGLDELQMNLEQEDNQFYFNAAYQNALKNELSARSDYRSALDTERNRVLGERENRFRSTQSDYDRQLQEDLSRSDLQRSYESNAARLKAARDSAESSKRGQLFSQIGSTLGTVGGAALGGPVGAIVGGQVGGGLGTVGSKLG